MLLSKAGILNYLILTTFIVSVIVFIISIAAATVRVIARWIILLINFPLLSILLSFPLTSSRLRIAIIRIIALITLVFIFPATLRIILVFQKT